MNMIKKLQAWTLAILFVATSGGALMSTALPQPVSASCGDGALLTLPAWYRGIADDNDCKRIKSPTEVGGLSAFIWKIVLNIIDIVLQLIGYLSAGFIIYGGFLFLTSAGAPDGMVKARKTIMNAAIGLVLSIMSVAIVNFIAGSIK
jgi:hypothetical protein